MGLCAALLGGLLSSRDGELVVAAQDSPAGVAASEPGRGPGPPSFRRDVMAVLSKAGCNLGACHGAANGKGGFKLSLRGDDPDSDHAALTRDFHGRRINRLTAEDSLLLQKPTLAAPHEGGRRFAPDAPEYDVFHRWISAGALDDSHAAPEVRELHVGPHEAILMAPEHDVQLRATAVFADGSTADVSRWAVYEPSRPIVDISPSGLVQGRESGETTVVVRYLTRQAPVRLAFIPNRPAVAAAPLARNAIDDFIYAKLAALRLPAAPVCDDSAFVRRVHLDLLGLLPTADDARAFVESPDPDKRRVLVERLLERPEFAEHWALHWADLLRCEERTLDRKGVENLHAWLRVHFAEDRPWTELARRLLSAQGSTYAEPATNFYRALRDPLSRAEATAQVFLGVRLQCAKCHSHPFDRWTQSDYYAWANAFARVDYKIVENRRRDNNDSHEFDGEQIVYGRPEGDVDDPRTGRPRSVRMLDEHAPELPGDADRLEHLADWVCGPGNPYFAQAQVNRVWHHLFGRGLVDPLDDFRATNPASHPELLDWLAKEFTAHDTRLKPLLRTIMDSAAYQRSSAEVVAPGDTLSLENFAVLAPRRLTAEQLADAVGQVLDHRMAFSGYPAGLRAGQLPGVVGRRRRGGGGPASGDRFLTAFGKPMRQQSCECERSSSPTLAQTFQLVGGRVIDEALTAGDNLLGQHLDAGASDDDLLDELTWRALGRGPTSAERDAARGWLATAASPEARRATFEDLAWALLNSNEFLFRR